MTVQAGTGGQGSTGEAAASGAGGESGGSGASASTAGAVAPGGGNQAGTGAEAPATAGRSNTGAAAPAGDKSGTSSAELDALRARNAELEGLLSDAVDRRKAATTKAEQAEARAKQAEGKERQRASVDAVVAQVPEAHRTAATDALFRLQAEGKVDLSGEDREAVVKTAIEKLKAERASYFEAPSTVPRIPGVNAGGVTVQKVGVTDAKGNRLI